MFLDMEAFGINSISNRFQADREAQSLEKEEQNYKPVVEAYFDDEFTGFKRSQKSTNQAFSL